MATHIVLLRGINVGGKRKLPMAGLKQLLTKLGCTDVRTYVQSGNAVLEHPDKPNVLAQRIAAGIEKQFDLDVPTQVLTAKQVKDIIAKNPFTKEKGIDLAKLHVTFLDSAPKAADVAAIAEGNYDTDRFSVDGNVVYLHCPVDYGHTKLNNTFFEKKLKVGATTRNWRTVNQLLGISAQG
ncbi:MAG: DUF1697 domain-containing protein [Flavobacteriales bacterium]